MRNSAVLVNEINSHTKMFKKVVKFLFADLFLIACLLTSLKTSAQQKVAIDDRVNQHIFAYGEITCLEDPKGSLQFSQVAAPQISSKFEPSWSSTPQNYNRSSVYWYKISIEHASTKKSWILEFFDQTIDDITAYIPVGDGTYKIQKFGALHKFAERQTKHKNFEIDLDTSPTGTYTYYFRIRSHQTADVIIVLRSVKWFIEYALSEYLLFGVFYGMILVFAFYNLLMFVAIRQRQHLYYVLYNLSVGFYELCNDGIGYQYLWPDSPVWNEYAYGFALCCVSVFALMFTNSLLLVKKNAPALYKLINVTIAARIGFFLVCFFLNKQWFNYKFIEAGPLCIAFYTGVYILIKGYKPARFFVLGYSFLFTGFLLKILAYLGWLTLSGVGYYSLSICFILEMVLLAFAIGDNVRVLKKEKDNAQREMIDQLTEKRKLEASINIKLEDQVKQRTGEVLANAIIIEKQNEELNKVNEVLKRRQRIS
ncbi:MAG: hypothetical protein NVSMB24_18600 [Mucilaginibacter sp.]